ncbi:hypothetical protein HanPI659440_Chr12g0467911 [Helianthus annuus]|nr:hypothetical protein HanPI659440_Chr12g0467911 [Helianthus annuus]
MTMVPVMLFLLVVILKKNDDVQVIDQKSGRENLKWRCTAAYEVDGGLGWWQKNLSARFECMAADYEMLSRVFAHGLRSFCP